MASALVTRGFAAVKTGTSKDLRDNWCVGFTDRYTVAVWVGNASGAPMRAVSGVSGAAPIWHAVVQHLHEHRPSMSPSIPAGVITQPVTFAANREPMRNEVFIRGTEQSSFLDGMQAATRQRFGIHSPRDKSIFALDPDIPPKAQQIRFEGEAGTWLLDGHVIGQGPSSNWAPWPGRHEVSLKPADGSAPHVVHLEVRGATTKSPPAVNR
jgi:penicillin-binding protein 1C